jgi:hypothetical protein
MLIESDLKKNKKDALLKAIRSVPKVLTAFEIKFADIKNPETFLTDIEMHLIDIRKETKTVAKNLKG